MENTELEFSVPEGYDIIFHNKVVDRFGNTLLAESFGFEYFLMIVPSEFRREETLKTDGTNPP